MKEFFKKVLNDYIVVNLRFFWKSFRRMFWANDNEKFGNHNNKSNQQVTLIRVLFILLAACFVIMILRLTYIVTYKGDEYKKNVYSQRQSQDEIIPYERGSIYDSKGSVLASNIKKYIVVLDARQVSELSKNKGNPVYIEDTAEALHEYLGYDKDEIYNFIIEHPTDSYERISKDENGKVIALDAETVRPLQDHIAETRSSNSKERALYGIYFEDSYERYYPNGSLACDVLGYVKTNENAGVYGLEQYYDGELNGVDGRTFGYINDYTNLEKEIVPAKNGNSLILNLDLSIQRIVEEKIKEINETMDTEERDGSYNTGVIIMEADNGKILAMAGYPFYDLNDPKSVVPEAYYSEKQINELTSKLAISNKYVDGISSNIFFDNGEIPYFKVLNEETGKDEIVNLTQEQLDKLDNDLSSYVRDNVWKNFCISDTYEPGSVAKTVTTAIGLDSGKLNGNEYFECYGETTVKDRIIHCSHKYGCGGGDLRTCLVKSCNPAFTKFGKIIDKETFLRYSKDFYGVKTGIDLTGEVSADKLIFTEATLNETELATASFGQGFNVTMIQMISAFDSLINGGSYYEPHVVNKIVDDSGCVVKIIEPKFMKQTVSESTSDKIRDYCIGVVEDEGGTGGKARPAGYRIGGKTGTAQISGVGGYQEGQYVVSFASFAPADDPQIVMYVVIDRPNIPDQSSGAVNQACMLTRNIYTEILPYLNIPMTEELTDAEREELENQKIYTSNIVTNDDTVNTEGEEGAYTENPETSENENNSENTL